MSTFYDNLPYTAEIIRLAQNENPYGSSPKAIAAIRNHLHTLHQYPVYHPKNLIDKIAMTHGISADHVAVSAGSVEMIDLIIKAFTAFDEEAIIPEISFVAYQLLCEVNRRKTIQAEMSDFTIDTDNILKAITPLTKLVFIANPNNPTATIVREKALIEFLNRVPENVLVVLDEAYAEYVADPRYPKSLSFYEDYPNLIILRTFSKIYGLAGLRIGYSVSSAQIAEKLQQTRTPFSVSKLSEVAATAALDDTSFVSECAEKNAVERSYLTKHLRKLGFHVPDTHTNFIFLSLPGIGRREKINDILYSNGVVVRKTDPFGDSTALRITLGKHKANQKVIDLLTKEC